MTKLWLILGFISLLLGLFGYLDQELRCHASWNWDQFWHHEPLVGIAVCVGIVLLVVAVIEYMGNRNTNSRDPNERGPEV